MGVTVDSIITFTTKTWDTNKPINQLNRRSICGQLESNMANKEGEEAVVNKGESSASAPLESAEDQSNSLGIPTAEFVVSIGCIACTECVLTVFDLVFSQMWMSSWVGPKTIPTQPSYWNGWTNRTPNTGLWNRIWRKRKEDSRNRSLRSRPRSMSWN